MTRKQFQTRRKIIATYHIPKRGHKYIPLYSDIHKLMRDIDEQLILPPRVLQPRSSPWTKDSFCKLADAIGRDGRMPLDPYYLPQNGIERMNEQQLETYARIIYMFGD